MEGMMSKMMLSCKKATELIEKQWVVRLSMQENIQLKIHTTMCSACKEYQKQSEIIERVLERMNTKANFTTTLAPEIKEKIIKELEKN